MANIDRDACRRELRRIIEQSLECAARMEELLHDEQSALKARDPGKIRAVTSSKELCIRCLENLHIELQDLCAAAGYDGSSSGIDECLAWCDDNGRLRKAWKQLIDCAERCEALNRTNGAIGRVRYEQIMNVLAVFDGGNTDAQLYGPAGQEPTSPARHALARV